MSLFIELFRFYCFMLFLSSSVCLFSFQLCCQKEKVKFLLQLVFVHSLQFSQLCLVYFEALDWLISFSDCYVFFGYQAYFLYIISPLYLVNFFSAVYFTLLCMVSSHFSLRNNLPDTSLSPCFQLAQLLYLKSASYRKHAVGPHFVTYSANLSFSLCI